MPHELHGDLETGALRERRRLLYEKGYAVTAKIGQGGMGEIYKARQKSVNRHVAVKVIRSGALKDKDQREAFMREAMVTGNLEHPNIIPVYDVGEADDGSLFYVMKEIRGVSWREVLHSKTLDENLDILFDVSDAIAFAHSKHIIHRDLKPDNIMLGEYGEVVVMDWGIAASTRKADPDNAAETVCAESLTSESDLSGSLEYMPPEAALGDIVRIGTRSDIYLLGGLLYLVVTGLTPHKSCNELFEGISAAARNVIQPTDKKGELIDIALKAMSTNLDERYDTVKEFREAIRQFRMHAESISLMELAIKHYENALKSKSYDDFSQALFGFRESLELWPGNIRSKEMVDAVLYSYAEYAFWKDDFDLSLSLLNPKLPLHSKLIEKVLAARNSRFSKKSRIRFLTFFSFSLLILLLVMMCLLLTIIEYERRSSLAAWDRAMDAEKKSRQLLHQMQNGK